MQGLETYKVFEKEERSGHEINSFNVRAGRISLQEAKEINEKYDGRKPHSLEIFSNMLVLQRMSLMKS